MEALITKTAQVSGGASMLFGIMMLPAPWPAIIASLFGVIFGSYFRDFSSYSNKFHSYIEVFVGMGISIIVTLFTAPAVYEYFHSSLDRFESPASWLALHLFIAMVAQPICEMIARNAPEYLRVMGFKIIEQKKS